MKTHWLKTVQPYFEEVWNGKKTFDVRKNDREFEAGDQVVLCEYAAETKEYLDRSVSGEILYILKDYPVLENGHIVFSFRPTKYSFDKFKPQ